MRNGSPGAPGQRGYSLVEMLVVVAMIGIFSLVTVPQFMTFYRQAKIRASIRQFNGHLRGARQLAITKNVQAAISFAPGANPGGGFLPGQYGIYQRNVDTSTTPDTITWVLVGQLKRLEEPVYFLASDFDTDDTTADVLHDVIFMPNGTVPNLPGAGETPTIEIKSDANVPNNHCTITMNAAGTFTSALSSD
jgi:prepilin-type N-terminal cleavage/methylation domain-containing protein